MKEEEKVNPWYTRPGGRLATAAPGGLLSPTLLFHKWHAYDCIEKSEEPKLPPEHKEVAVDFLGKVATATGAVLTAEGQDPRSYAWWWKERYLPALSGLGVRFTVADTLWRLVVGFGVNPAWESGITLHPLYGFPLIPGSAVKGLVHHTAEMALAARLESNAAGGEAAPPPPDGPILGEFLAAAEQIHRLFGSLTVTAASDPAYHAGGVPRPPRALLAAWLAEPWRQRLDEATIEWMERLLGHTGGRLVFYDAVPLSREPDLLQPDLLNPHYGDYYSSEGRDTPPSDDQNPVPVPFLAVRPDVRFAFPYRVRRDRRERWPGGKASDGEAGESGEGDAEVLGQVQRWLEEALTTAGAGAKTAAGYGYFQSVRHLEPKEPPAWQPARSRPQPDSGEKKQEEKDKPKGHKGTKPPPPPPTRGFNVLGSQLRQRQKPQRKPGAGAGAVQKGKKVKIEVVEKVSGGYRLRVLDTGQQDLFFEGRVRWEVGQRLQVKIVNLHPDGRIKQVKP